MAKKKVKFSDIINPALRELKPPPEDYSFPIDLDRDNRLINAARGRDENGINNDELQPTPIEAEWITQIRDYCKRNEIYPPHILEFYKEHHEHS